VNRADDTAWEFGWNGHEWHQLQRLAALTLAEKLQWLEEAQHLLHNLSALPGMSAASEDVTRGRCPCRRCHHRRPGQPRSNQ
jgi:hypothetical protein